MSTSATYGPLNFLQVLTKQFTQEAVYDDSGIDLLYHRITVLFSGYVHGITSAAITVESNRDNAVRTNAPETYNYIKGVLQQPRLPFIYQVDATDILNVNGFSQADGKNTNIQAVRLAMRDVTGGPKPKRFSITHVAGSHIFRVEVEMEVCVVIPGLKESKLQRGVLSNRWSCVDDIDANWMTTRTIQGRLVLYNPNLNPHSFRGWVVPELPMGFRRDRMTFVASADNLKIDYTVVDAEIAFSAPSPATTWNWSHSMHSGDGVLATTEIAVKMAGPRNANKKLMLANCMRIFDAKTLYATPGPLRGDLQSLTLTDSYADRDNAVELRGVMRHADQSAIMLKAYRSRLGTPIGAGRYATTIPGYDYRISRDPGTRGPAPATAAWANYLQNPYDDHHEITFNRNPA